MLLTWSREAADYITLLSGGLVQSARHRSHRCCYYYTYQSMNTSSSLTACHQYSLRGQAMVAQSGSGSRSILTGTPTKRSFSSKPRQGQETSGSGDGGSNSIGQGHKVVIIVGCGIGLAALVILLSNQAARTDMDFSTFRKKYLEKGKVSILLSSPHNLIILHYCIANARYHISAVYDLHRCERSL